MPGSCWMLDESKFLSAREVKKLRTRAKDRAKKTHGSAHRTAFRDYFITELALSTGLRVSEMANLRCGEIFIEDGRSSLLVRRGKGGKPRNVWFSRAFKKQVKLYLQWKEEVGEPVSDNAPLLRSVVTGASMTTRAIQKVFKRCAACANISSHYSVHSLRHTYASYLFRASNHNLKTVQEQLGHARIETTQVYAHVIKPDLQQALEKLYK